MKQTYVLVSGVSALVGAALSAIVVIWFMKPELTTQEFRPQIDKSQSEKFVTQITPDPEPVARAPASKGAFENVRTLADTLAFEADFDQTVAIHLLLANADEALVLDLLEQAETISPPSQKEAAFSIIFSKYAALDPSRALARAEGLPQRLHRRVLMNIFHEWSRNDLESAIEAAESLEDNYRQTAGYVILTSRDDLAPSRRAEIAEQFNQQQQLAMLNQQVWLERALENPRSAWQEILDSTDPEQQSRGARISVAHAWIRKEGIAVLDEIVASLPNTRDTRRFLSSLLPSLVKADPQRTLDFISQLPNAQETAGLRQQAFHVWSRQDPEAAAETLQEMDFHNKKHVMETVLSQWAYKDPRELLEASDGMPQSWIDAAKRHALTQLSRSSRQEAISYLGDISDSNQRHQVENTLASQWAEEDPSAAMRWYVSLDRGRAGETTHHLRYLMRSVTDRDPAMALQVAAEYSGKWGSAMIGGVFETLARADPQQALQYLPRVNQEQKKVAVGSIGSAMARDDLMKALQLGIHLDQTERLQFGRDLIDNSLYRDVNREAFISDFNDLSSRELKAYGASQLISQDAYEQFLTKNERQRLYAVLNATEKAKLEEQLQYAREYLESKED